MAALFLTHGLLRAAYPCKFALRGNHGGERHAILSAQLVGKNGI